MWLYSAGRLPGIALQVGIELWYRAGLHKSRKVRFSGARLARTLQVGRASVSRGLEALRQSSLVLVEQRTGRPSFVTVIFNEQAEDKRP